MRNSHETKVKVTACIKCTNEVKRKIDDGDKQKNPVKTVWDYKKNKTSNIDQNEKKKNED